jgi:Fur family ferric uptake transcriptional regulator
MKFNESIALTQEKKKFENHLAELGLQLSRARKMVLNEVINIHGHFTAEELAKACYKRSKISRASVYRTLKELLESGVIRETAFGDKHHHFEHLYDEKPHHHAQCIRCYKFIEFPDMKEDEIYRPHLEKQGFKIIGHEMHFYGICQKCQNNPKKK